MGFIEKRVLQTWSALVGICGSTYLELLDALDVELFAGADAMEWPLLVVGAAGTGSILYTSWHESRRHSLEGRHGRRPR